MKGFSYNIDTKTDLSTGDIFQTLTQEFNDIRTTLIRDVLKTKEEQTRAALISLGWTPPIPNPSKCIVHGCQNHSHEGSFIGNMCIPCFHMITTGVVGHGHTFINEMSENVAKANAALEYNKKNSFLYSEIKLVFKNALESFWQEKQKTNN